MRDRKEIQHLGVTKIPETELSERDPILARVIAAQSDRWPSEPIEDPIWGLVRMVIAQQVSTSVACGIAERVRSEFPELTASTHHAIPNVADLRALGLPERRAVCCIEVIVRSHEIMEMVRNGSPWELALAGIKGIGPWTLATFRVMVLRHPDVLPLGDVGLQRAVFNLYGDAYGIEHLSERWRPYRSVACWYLWRTLGNKQLG